MRKIHLVFGLFLLSIMTVGNACKEKAVDRPNIVWITSEDNSKHYMKLFDENGIETPVIEVHISNVYQRENFRHTSYIAPNVRGVITGFGLQSYELALRSFIA